MVKIKSKKYLNCLPQVHESNATNVGGVTMIQHHIDL